MVYKSERPRHVVTKELADKFDKLRASGLSGAMAAKRLGFSYLAFTNYKKRVSVKSDKGKV